MFSDALWLCLGYNVVTNILAKPQNQAKTYRGRVTSNLLQAHTESKKRKEKKKCSKFLYFSCRLIMGHQDGFLQNSVHFSITGVTVQVM